MTAAIAIGIEMDLVLAVGGTTEEMIVLVKTEIEDETTVIARTEVTVTENVKETETLIVESRSPLKVSTVTRTILNAHQIRHMETDLVDHVEAMGTLATTVEGVMAITELVMLPVEGTEVAMADRIGRMMLVLLLEEEDLTIGSTVSMITVQVSKPVTTAIHTGTKSNPKVQKTLDCRRQG